MKLPDMLRRWNIYFLCTFAAISYNTVWGQSSPEFLVQRNLTGIRGGNLTVAVNTAPASFNQLMTTGLDNRVITERISADLVHINRATMQLEPSLATHWDLDKTGRNYTIYLRRGIQFSDGTPFSADDVVFTFQVLADPKTQSPMAGQIEIDGRPPSVTKVDRYTVRLQFKSPVGMGLRVLDSIPILPKHRLLRAYQAGSFTSTWGPAANPKDVVGLGPFRLKKYISGTSVSLERNPYYWKLDRSQQRLPYLDAITFLFTPSSEAEALLLKNGELDLASSPSLSPGDYAMLRRKPGDLVLRDLGPGLTMDFLWFNLNRNASGKQKAFVDPEKAAIFEKTQFRTAVSLALDREGMARSLFQGLGVPQYGPVSSGNAAWYNAGISRTGYNPARARMLLAQTGLRDANGDGILEYGAHKHPLDIILFTSRDNSRRERMAQVIQDNLSKVGIRVGLQFRLPGDIASRFLSSFEYEAILFGFTPTDIEPDLQTDLWYSRGSLHFWHPGQEKPERPWEASIDSLISRLTRSIDGSIRHKSFAEVQQIWAREMPAIPTVTPKILAAWNRRVGNIRPSILAPHLIWNAEELTKNRP